jgi:hypothetical protein
MLNLRNVLSAAGLLTGRTVSNDALSKALEDGLEAGRAILKELLVSRPPLSVLACFDARRSGCSAVNDVLRLMIGSGSSSSDALSSSSYKPGYWRLRSCCDACRMFLGVSSSSSAGPVSVRARPVSSMMRRVRGLRISGIDLRDPPLCRFSGDERREIVEAAAGTTIRDSIDNGLLFLIPLSVLLRCSPDFTFSAEPEDEFVLLREC